MNKEYQVVIIGGGPAGLSAGLYTSRARLSTLLIERGLVGGLITETELVENYPGFPEGIGGLELGQLMHQQATKYGLEILLAEITGLELKQGQKIIRTTEGDFAAETAIIASGSERLKLGVPGEKEFAGRGVSYCATCDAAFFRELPVAVAGSGDVGITEALYLTKFASKVTVIELLPKLGASRILQERATAEPKIEFRLNTKVEEIEGEEVVKRLRLRQVITGEKSNLDVAALFVSIGIKPNTDYLKGILSLDASGNIITNDKLETSIPGIFAAGDVRQSSAQQAITAAGDGATAAIYAEKFISE
jgi:thioredoxin reductase (NADPH)